MATIDLQALFRGRAQNEEPRVRTCNMGTGCEEYGVRYAAAHGKPEECPCEQTQKQEPSRGNR